MIAGYWSLDGPIINGEILYGNIMHLGTDDVIQLLWDGKVVARIIIGA